VGSGFKTFTAGSVLTASDVQNYLQDQAVMVFGGTAARSSAIGTANFEEGMLTYLTDVDKLQVYTGSSFEDVYPPAATNQGMTLINTTSFSGVASQSINNVFSATYDYYRIIVNNQPSASGFPRLRLRASGTDATSADYSWQQLLFSNTSVSAERNTGDTTWNLSGTGGANQTMYLQIEIYNPFASVNTWGLSQSYQSGAGQSNHFRINTSASYDGFTFYPSTGNMTGALSVYGFSK
jgi:hypothetical protein